MSGPSERDDQQGEHKGEREVLDHLRALLSPLHLHRVMSPSCNKRLVNGLGVYPLVVQQHPAPHLLLLLLLHSLLTLLMTKTMISGLWPPLRNLVQKSIREQ